MAFERNFDTDTGVKKFDKLTSKKLKFSLAILNI